MTSARSPSGSTPRSAAPATAAAARRPSAAAKRDVDAELIALAAGCAHDPLRYVRLAYPWGEPGELEEHAGPDAWQQDALGLVGRELDRGNVVRLAVAGGVGPGKSAFLAWIVDWGMTTAVNCRGRITADTGPQLSSTTWPEIAKWSRLSLWSAWFELGDRRLRAADPRRRDSWRTDALTWDEHNAQAFAGFHNAGRRIVLGFDEASAIADVIHEKSEGVLSGAGNTEIVWIELGNPSENAGYFRTLFPGGSRAHLWHSRHIDTRTARMADQAQIREWIDYYGLDSDYVRVHVLSQFPRAGSTQFIAAELIEAAADPQRDAPVTLYDPLVVGVDVARFGADKSVIRFRRGRDARTIAPLKFRGLDTMQLAARVAEVNERYRPDRIFVDDGGIGGGVVDRCRMLRLPVTPVSFGAEPDRSGLGRDSLVAYFNKRAEMYGEMREWLEAGMIDADPELKADLGAVRYGFKLRDGRDAILLERKADMKKRGLASPDDADALALTFAYPVAPTDHTAQLSRRPPHQVDYDPFAQGYRR